MSTPGSPAGSEAGSRVTRCGRCGRPIVWAVARATGRRMPFEPEPRSRGPWRVELAPIDPKDPRPDAPKILFASHEQGRTFGHVPHFGNCLPSGRARRRRR